MKIETTIEGKTIHQVYLGKVYPMPKWRDEGPITEAPHVLIPQFMQGASIICTVPHEVAHTMARLETMRGKLETTLDLADQAGDYGLRDELRVNQTREVETARNETAKELRALADWLVGKNTTHNQTRRFTRTLDMAAFKEGGEA